MVSSIALKRFLTPKLTEYIKWIPTPKQQAFLCLSDWKEVFYGGAARGGKSIALLMAALQYVDVPGYDAVLIRDTSKNLMKPKGLYSIALEWLYDSRAAWNGKLDRWEFPTGKNKSKSIRGGVGTNQPASLSFGYMDGPKDHLNYQGPSYHFVGFDEVVNIRKNQAMYLHSRLTKDVDIPVPLRFRAASNPPSREQVARGSWVKERYIDDKTRKRGVVYLAANLYDNEHIDQQEYIQSLSNLDPTTRLQLLEGDWEVSAKGAMFDRAWFEVVDQSPRKGERMRWWDLAASKPRKGHEDPDYTAGPLCNMSNGVLYVEDLRRLRDTAGQVEKLITQTAMLDGKNTRIRMEQEPGASGKMVIAAYAKILAGRDFKGIPSTGAKETYYGPLASYAEAGNVKLVKAQWNKEFLDEAELAPNGPHDDAIESVAKNFAELAVNNQETYGTF